nr:T9SS type A sorting domain-containing protein [Rhodothermaceae bacterium]
TPDKGVGITEGSTTASFVVKNGVRLLGGFDRDDFSQGDDLPLTWDWETNKTILSGDLQSNDNLIVTDTEPSRSDNSLHVVVIPWNIEESAVIEGFFIQGGHSNGDGGGMLIHRGVEQYRLSNVIFENNFAVENGGGLSNLGGALWMDNVTFKSNVSESTGGGFFHEPAKGEIARITNTLFRLNSSGFGGGMYISGGGLEVAQSIFLKNFAGAGGAVMHRFMHPNNGIEGGIYANVLFLGNITTSNGGAFCNEDESIITVYNSVFSGNESRGTSAVGSLGGAIVNFESTTMTFYQTTLANNTAREGGAIYSSSGKVSFYNSIIYNNQSEVQGAENLSIRKHENSVLTMDHNILEGAFPDSVTVMDMGGNFFEDPLFVDPLGPDGIAGTLDDDLRLQPTSPAIDAGDNNLLQADVLDLDNDGDTTELLPLDMDRLQRVARSDQLQFVDLGAFEFNSQAPISTHIEDRAISSTCTSGALAPAYPNPFSSQTNVSICVPSAGLVEVTLYDILGRARSQVFEQVVQANQQYSIVIDRDDLASGVYFVRLKHAEVSATRSITLMN